MNARVVILVALSTVACGKSSEPAPASTPVVAPATNAAPTTRAPEQKEVATGNTLTEFQKSRLLGHYSTADGASGFILDRTVTPWRAKLDGTSKVVTMEQTNQPQPGEKEFKSSSGGAIWLRVDMESGHVLLFQGPKQHEGVRVLRDADAEPLK